MADDFESAFDEASADSGTPHSAPTGDQANRDAPQTSEPSAPLVDKGVQAATQPVEKPAESQTKVDEGGQKLTEPAPAKPDEGKQPQEPAPQEPTPAPAPAQQPPQQPPQPAPQQPQALDPRYLAQAILEAQQQAAAQQQRQQPAQPPARKTLDDFLNDTQKAAINKFREEWPDEFQAVGHLYNAQLQAEMANYQAQQDARLNELLAPLIHTVGSVEVNSHRGAILAAHPDLDSLDMGKVQEWITAQPPLFQAPLMQAFQGGNAREAIELLNMYKQSTGSAGAAPATPAPQTETKTTPAAPAAPKPVDPAAKAALAAVPPAQRQQPSARGADEDYDAAFKEAVGQG